MIIDSHCHAWAFWPYPQPVPDPETRGRMEQLLYEMDTNGVEQACVVCAQIDHNPANNAYVAAEVQRHPTRLHQLVDLDSEWSPTYHTPGAAQRLRQMAEAWPIFGFTHYLNKQEDGEWLCSEEGLALFQAAADLGLVASLSCYAQHMPAIRRVAERFPQAPILYHHLGHIGLSRGTIRENLKEVLASARLPNIYIKLSGYAYVAQRIWDYPYDEVRWIIQAEYDVFGPQRMCWGSDYPVVRTAMTYKQSLEVFRTHCSFAPAEDQAWILGGTLQSLLK